MKRIILLLFVAAVCTNCSVKPEPLRYSIDNCHFCKMTLADDRFGAELVTQKGKVFKFDDIKCMVAFLNSAEGKANDYSFELVVDYAHSADEFDLVPATDAFYVQAAEVKSPMAGNVAAFKNQVAQQAYQKKWNGVALKWNEAKEALK